MQINIMYLLYDNQRLSLHFRCECRYWNSLWNNETPVVCTLIFFFNIVEVGIVLYRVSLYCVIVIVHFRWHNTCCPIIHSHLQAELARKWTLRALPVAPSLAGRGLWNYYIHIYFDIYYQCFISSSKLTNQSNAVKFIEITKVNA